MLSLEAGEPEPLEVIPSDYSAEDNPRRTTLRNLPLRNHVTSHVNCISTP